MADLPPGLYDSFAEQGLFWLPGNRDDQVPGTISYDPENGTILKLLGIFGELHDAIGKAFGGSDRYDEAVIHGMTMKGRPISLLHCISVNRQINMPGIPHETWKSNLLVMGAHIESADDEEIFPKSYFRFDEIEAWLEHSSFTDTFDVEARALSVLAEIPREVAFASHVEFDVSSVGSLHYRNDTATRFDIEVTSMMAITAREPKSLNWHLNRAVGIQELASLCTGHFLPLTAFELRGPDVELSGGGTRGNEVHFYASMIHGEGRENSKSKRRTPIITGPELNRFNPKAMQIWFDQFEVFSPALRLFFTITSGSQMFTNIRLLLAIQALEVFHRRTSSETVMAQHAFGEFSKSMVEAIPPDTEPRMREKLETLYGNANEPSLQQRLRAIIDSLTEAFGSRPGGFNSRFIRKLVDTRNYYTHFSESLSERTLDGEGMYWATRRVILLLTLLFLQRLGMAANDIKPLLQRHREFAQLWEKADRPR